jgi:hypothetical protein
MNFAYIAINVPNFNRNADFRENVTYLNIKYRIDLVMKKGTFGNSTGFGHLQTSETSGRNMAVELDNRNPLLPKTG